MVTSLEQWNLPADEDEDLDKFRERIEEAQDCINDVEDTMLNSGLLDPRVQDLQNTIATMRRHLNEWEEDLAGVPPQMDGAMDTDPPPQFDGAMDTDIPLGDQERATTEFDASGKYSSVGVSAPELVLLEGLPRPTTATSSVTATAQPAITTSAQPSNLVAEEEAVSPPPNEGQQSRLVPKVCPLSISYASCF